VSEPADVRAGGASSDAGADAASNVARDAADDAARDVAGPLLTLPVHQVLVTARDAGSVTAQCSLDLDRSATSVELRDDGWIWNGRRFPYLRDCRPRTIYYWTGSSFQPLARYTLSLVKLVPTAWGAPTFEIDGIKMLPTLRVSPWDDAARKVGLIAPRGKRILDTCGGLGYFAAFCLRGEAAHVHSYEINADVIWLRNLNPWSPDYRWAAAPVDALTLACADVTEHMASIPSESFDAILHDPPRFGIAGNLYSQVFYDQLARVLKRRGRLFHYTGSPNSLSRGRDLASEVAVRLRRAGFTAELEGDGVLAVRNGSR
jgi:predicted methyltransferase